MLQARARTQRVDGLRDERCDGDRDDVETVLPRLQARDHEKVVDEAEEAFTVALDDLEHDPLVPVDRAAVAVAQHLEVTDDAGQRRAELV